MGNFKRLLVMVILFAMLVPMSAVQCLAAPPNTQDIDIINFKAPISGSSNTYKKIAGRSKETKTPIYLFITNISNSFVRVRVYGQYAENVYCDCYVNPKKDKTLKCPHKQSCTYWGGGWAPYVRCEKMVKHQDRGYSVQSVVKEWGWRYGALGFQSAHNEKDDYVTGWWSVDSGSTYDTPMGP